MSSLKLWLKGAAACVVAVPMVLTTTVALGGGHTDSTTLPNGANLSVQIDEPADEDEFKVPANADGSAGGTINVGTDGSASVGQGDPNILLMFAVDVSFSTSLSCDGRDIIGCEKDAVLNVLADPNILSVLETGIVVYGEQGAAADMTPAGGDDPITNPNANLADVQTVVNSISTSDCVAGVNQFTAKNVGCDGTNYTAGLVAANTIVGASGAATLRLLFLSDGLSNEGGGGYAAALQALVDAGVQIDSFAVGGGSSCGGGTDGTLQQMADDTNGTCTELDDPADIVTVLPNLIATSLDDVDASLDGNDVATNTAPNPPVVGPVTVDYDATNNNLGVGDYVIDAEADGSDNAGNATVSAAVDIHLLQLIASPSTASNELSEDNSHSVDGQILGGTGADRDIDFEVTAGPNAGPSDSENATPGGAAVSFGYSVDGNECSSLGTDTIRVSTTIGGMGDFIDLTKDWVDTIAPTATCTETVNPHGRTTPPAGSSTLPGPRGGINEDGFYLLEATDNLSGASCAALVINAEDADGFAYGPFAVGDIVKYVENNDIPQEEKQMGSRGGPGRATAVSAHLIGHGDLLITATDGAGNVSAVVECLVPEPPK